MSPGDAFSQSARTQFIPEQADSPAPVRFDYGSIIPWVRSIGGGIRAIAGPNTIYCRGDVSMRGEGLVTISEFEIGAGDRRSFDLTWTETYGPIPERQDTQLRLDQTEQFWRDWSSRYPYDGPWREAVMRSLITLKARDVSLYALTVGGYTDEALAWREWLVHSVAGRPEELQIMNGVAGERRLTEYQLDVYGRIMDVLHLTRRLGFPPDENSWRVQRAIMRFLETGWKEPDEGIWEVRGPRRHFTHSKAMAWVAFDRAIAAVEKFGMEGPVELARDSRRDPRRSTRKRLRHLNAFVQFYGSGSADGLPPREGPFPLCTFRLADVLALQGNYEETEAIFEQLLALRNDVGLLAEQ